MRPRASSVRGVGKGRVPRQPVLAVRRAPDEAAGASVLAARYADEAKENAILRARLSELELRDEQRTAAMAAKRIGRRWSQKAAAGQGGELGH